MGTVTYKGIELGKPANSYSVVEVSELVALYFKNHADSSGVCRASVRSALEDMFGRDGDVFRNKIRTVSKLIKYIGYRPGQDENGTYVWYVPDSELYSGGIRVRRDIPDMSSNVAVKGTIPDGLRKNIEKRKRTIINCEVCGKEIIAIGIGPHMRSHFGKLGKNGNELLDAISEYPELTSGEYATLLGWDMSKVRVTMGLLRKNKKVESTGKGHHTKYNVVDVTKAEEVVIDIEIEEPPVVDKNATPIKVKSVPAKKVETQGHGIVTITAIKSVDGTLYHFDDGKIYEVRLEEVTL